MLSTALLSINGPGVGVVEVVDVVEVDVVEVVVGAAVVVVVGAAVVVVVVGEGVVVGDTSCPGAQVPGGRQRELPLP